MSVYQYAKSTDSAVIEAIERNRAGQFEWRDRALAFASAHGAEAFYPDLFGGKCEIYSIDTETAPTTGRWKRATRGWVPWKNNPVAAEMDAITFTKEPVPGLPEMLHGGRYLLTPTPFLHAETAWVGFNVMPERYNAHDDFGPQWVEIKASEYHAALEAVTA